MYQSKENKRNRNTNAKNKHEQGNHRFRKWGLRILLLYLMGACLMMCGCSTKSIDNQFIRSLEKGLTARWDVTDQCEKGDDVLTKSDYENFIDAELDQISKFEDEKFEDEELGKLAKEYISITNNSLEILKDFQNDSKFESEWEKLKNDRTECLAKINKKKPLEFSSERDQEYFDGLISQGEVVAGVREIQKNVNFKVKDDEDDDETYHTYVATVENTTDTEFDSFDLDIKLVDKNGKTLETTYASASNWKPGEKAEFEFLSDKKFDKIEIAECEYYY